MERKKLSKSLRKHISQEKARIRRGVLSPEEIDKKILELYQMSSKKAKDLKALPQTK
jgi:hypothetical protein